MVQAFGDKSASPSNVGAGSGSGNSTPGTREYVDIGVSYEPVKQKVLSQERYKSYAERETKVSKERVSVEQAKSQVELGMQQAVQTKREKYFVASGGAPTPLAKKSFEHKQQSFESGQQEVVNRFNQFVSGEQSSLEQRLSAPPESVYDEVIVGYQPKYTSIVRHETMPIKETVSQQDTLKVYSSKTGELVREIGLTPSTPTEPSVLGGLSKQEFETQRQTWINDYAASFPKSELSVRKGATFVSEFSLLTGVPMGTYVKQPALLQTVYHPDSQPSSLLQLAVKQSSFDSKISQQDQQRMLTQSLMTAPQAVKTPGYAPATLTGYTVMKDITQSEFETGLKSTQEKNVWGEYIVPRFFERYDFETGVVGKMLTPQPTLEKQLWAGIATPGLVTAAGLETIFDIGVGVYETVAPTPYKFYYTGLTGSFIAESKVADYKSQGYLNPRAAVLAKYQEEQPKALESSFYLEKQIAESGAYVFGGALASLSTWLGLSRVKTPADALVPLALGAGLFVAAKPIGKFGAGVLGYVAPKVEATAERLFASKSLVPIDKFVPRQFLQDPMVWQKTIGGAIPAIGAVGEIVGMGLTPSGMKEKYLRQTSLYNTFVPLGYKGAASFKLFSEWAKIKTIAAIGGTEIVSAQSLQAPKTWEKFSTTGGGTPIFAGSERELFESAIGKTPGTERLFEIAGFEPKTQFVFLRSQAGEYLGRIEPRIGAYEAFRADFFSPELHPIALKNIGLDSIWGKPAVDAEYVLYKSDPFVEVAFSKRGFGVEAPKPLTYAAYEEVTEIYGGKVFAKSPTSPVKLGKIPVEVDTTIGETIYGKIVGGARPLKSRDLWALIGTEAFEKEVVSENGGVFKNVDTFFTSQSRAYGATIESEVLTEAPRERINVPERVTYSWTLPDWLGGKEFTFKPKEYFRARGIADVYVEHKFAMIPTYFEKLTTTAVEPLGGNGREFKQLKLLTSSDSFTGGKVVVGELPEGVGSQYVPSTKQIIVTPKTTPEMLKHERIHRALDLAKNVDLLGAQRTALSEYKQLLGAEKVGTSADFMAQRLAKYPQQLRGREVLGTFIEAYPNELVQPTTKTGKLVKGLLETEEATFGKITIGGRGMKTIVPEVGGYTEELQQTFNKRFAFERVKFSPLLSEPRRDTNIDYKPLKLPGYTPIKYSSSRTPFYPLPKYPDIKTPTSTPPYTPPKYPPIQMPPYTPPKYPDLKLPPYTPPKYPSIKIPPYQPPTSTKGEFKIREEEKYKKKKLKIPGFIGLSRRKGKFLRVTDVLPKGLAWAGAIGYTKKTLARSATVKQAGEIESDYDIMPSTKGYRLKNLKSKIREEPLLIQQNALSFRSEVREIQQAKKQKGLFRSLNIKLPKIGKLF